MGLSSFLRRSFTDAKKVEGRSSAQPPRRHSVHGSDAAAAAFYKAKGDYEREESRIMKEELRMRNQNDKECKRQMDMIERNKNTERRSLDTAISYRRNNLIALYRAGRIDARQLDKMKRKVEKQADEQWTSYMKRCKEEQSKAQRIFFSRGEEIAANTGAALRRAKAKMERSQRRA